MLYEIAKNQAERMDISNALYERLADIEDCEKLLRYTWEKFYSTVQHEEMGENDIEHLGLVLRIAADKLYDILLDYMIMTGARDWRGVPYAFATSEHILEIRRVNELDDKVTEAIRNMPQGEKQNTYKEERARAIHLPDAEAIKALESLLNKLPTT